MPLENLLKYYIECIEIESLEDLSYPSFKINERFILYPYPIEWSVNNNNTIDIQIPHFTSRLLAMGGSTALYYGWPVFVRPAIDRNENPYCWIEPVFLLRVEYEHGDNGYSLTVLKEWPKINDRILKRFTQTIEERIQILDEIGVSEAEELHDEGLFHYWQRLSERYPALTNAIQDIDPNNLLQNDFTGITVEGYYNKAVLMPATAPQYSRGASYRIKRAFET